MSNWQLGGLVSLVTGSSRGLGKQIAISLAKAGSSVIICARDKGNLLSVEKEIALGTKVFSYVLDATKPTEVAKMFKKIKSEVGQLDILVNNIGGVSKFGDFEDLRYEDWEGAFWQNLMSNVIFTKEALHLLRKSKNSRIINILTVPAVQPGKFNPHYSAAKAGVLNLTKYLASYLAGDKILVNALVLSSIEGETWQESVADFARRESLSLKIAKKKLTGELKQKVPLERLGRAEEVADTVVFLASKRASFITGAIINVDGGAIKSV